MTREQYVVMDNVMCDLQMMTEGEIPNDYSIMVARAKVLYDGLRRVFRAEYTIASSEANNNTEVHKLFDQGVELMGILHREGMIEGLKELGTYYCNLTDEDDECDCYVGVDEEVVKGWVDEIEVHFERQEMDLDDLWFEQYKCGIDLWGGIEEMFSRSALCGDMLLCLGVRPEEIPWEF